MVGTSWVVGPIRRWKRRSGDNTVCGGSGGIWQWRAVFCTVDNGSADPLECVSDECAVDCGVLILLELEDCISGDRAVDKEKVGVGRTI